MNGHIHHKFMTRVCSLVAALLWVVLVYSPSSQAQSATRGEVVKLAWIDPLSGLMGPVGANQLKTFQFAVDKANRGNPAGVRFELVTFDNKLSPAESLSALKAATDQGIRYVVQGNGSAVAGALLDAINKHNDRNPGKEVLLLNHSAVDPELTNSKCSHWHFRFDADTSMKMEVMTSYMKEQPELRSVYLINQNYSHGQQVARYAKEMLANKRPDVKVVGEELHALAQVRDFAPYVAKIKASGADAVITGNWGSDLSLLIKAAQEANYTGKFYTYYANVTGTPTALGSSGAGRVYAVVYSHYNMGGELQEWMQEFKARFNDDLYTHSILHLFNGLTQAMQRAGSIEPVKVAAALSGLKFKSFNGEVEMRRSDHQLQQPLYMLLWNPVTSAYPYSAENTGMTLVPQRRYDAYVASAPTSCQMQRR
jgi:branched-chain amino acid transport system substrate-binding protein